MRTKSEYSAGPNADSRESALFLAWLDFYEGVSAMQVWGALGWHDIRQRYRRSVIGPFWLTISSGTMIGALSYVYSGLFKQETSTYLPFIAVGLILWVFISAIVTESTTVFIAAEGLLKQLRSPLTLHMCRMVYRNLVIFFHNALILLVILIWNSTPITMHFLMIPIALLLICFNGVSLGIILGVFCTRFRDIVQLVLSLVQLLFFITPIMWSPQILNQKDNNRAWIAEYNPVYHVIETIRAPFLGQPFPTTSWLVILSLTLFIFTLAIVTLVKYRQRVAYWL